MKVAIYGGAFNPPHNGHLATIAKLLNSAMFDRIVVVPSGERPDKAGMTFAGERLHMTKLACSDAFPGEDKITVYGGQCEGRVGYGTIDLVRALAKQFPSDDLYVVIGQELVGDLISWKESEALAEQARFIVLSRPGVSQSMYPEKFKIQQLDLDPAVSVLVSSTEVREAIGCGRSVAGLVPSIVAQYISLRRLYKNQ